MEVVEHDRNGQKCPSAIACGCSNDSWSYSPSGVASAPRGGKIQRYLIPRGTDVPRSDSNSKNRCYTLACRLLELSEQNFCLVTVERDWCPGQQRTGAFFQSGNGGIVRRARDVVFEPCGRCRIIRTKIADRGDGSVPVAGQPSSIGRAGDQPSAHGTQGNLRGLLLSRKKRTRLASVKLRPLTWPARQRRLANAGSPTPAWQVARFRQCGCFLRIESLSAPPTAWGLPVKTVPSA